MVHLERSDDSQCGLELFPGSSEEFRAMLGTFDPVSTLKFAPLSQPNQIHLLMPPMHYVLKILLIFPIKKTNKNYFKIQIAIRAIINYDKKQFTKIKHRACLIGLFHAYYKKIQ